MPQGVKIGDFKFEGGENLETSVVRKIDELGRIVIPSEMRSGLGWNAGSKILITRAGNNLFLESYYGNCLVCGSEQDIVPIREKYICRTCIDELNAKE